MFFFLFFKFSTKSLFDVPANQEYVLIDDSFDQNFDWNEFLSNSLVTRCNSSSTGMCIHKM